ncbi:MAG: DUF5686 family protein [Bacteroidota bacterium]
MKRLNLVSPLHLILNLNLNLNLDLNLALLIGILCTMLPHVAMAQTRLVGSVRDASSGDGLAAANVRVIGTSRGTITNADGEFVLILDDLNSRLIVSMLGYKTDTVAVQQVHPFRCDVLLQPSPIVLPEIVISSEDPAIEIIRRAIANKRRWIERLKSYEMQAFTRQTLYRDTAVAAVTESFTKGYWQQGDTLREIITRKRQTANVAAGFNFASVGRILNFTDDEIRFVGYTFVGPTAIDALTYYDYRLLRTRASFGQEVFEIQLTPRTRTVPLFEGTVSVAGGSYALVGVDVRPGVAFRIPFVREGELRYRQQFSLCESTYWMPADIRIEGSFTLGIPGIVLPKIGFAQTSVITDYAINVAIPDTIFRKPRLQVDSAAARYDSASWAAHSVLPLSTDEEKAYKTLDSTQTLDVQFRPGGAAMTIGGDAGGLSSLLSHADVYFNRVEGFHLGGLASFDSLFPQVSAEARLGYGFSSKLTTYQLGLTWFPTHKRAVGIGGEAYRRIDHAPDRGYYGELFNSFTSLVSRNDYRNYHRADGGRLFITFQPSNEVAADLSFILEQHRESPQTTDYSFFSRSRQYRPNPPAAEEILRSLKADFRLGPKPVPFDFILRNSLEFSIEHSSPSFTGGQFHFTRYDALLTLGFPTFGHSYLLKPGFRIRATAGWSTGELPIQRQFAIESASGSFAPLGVMKAMEVREFGGTGVVSLSVEHNFRSIPFLALGIPFLYENSIELIIHGGAGRTWSNGIVPAPAVTDGWYYESGFSISRILDLFRADFTWRHSTPKGFRFTLGVAGLM